VPAVLSRASPRNIDWKMAAELRAKGCTYAKVAELTGASSGDAVRTGLARRGVGVAIRTAVALGTTKHAQEGIEKASEATKSHLSKAVLAQSESLSKIKISSNLRSIKAFGTAIEPLARTAKIVYGWGDQGPRSLVNVQVLSNLNVDELPDAGSEPIQVHASVQPEKELLSSGPDPAQAGEGKPL